MGRAYSHEVANYDQATLISRCRHKSDYCIYCMRTGWEDELHGKPFAAPGWEQLQVHGKSKYGLITVFNTLLRVHLRAMGFHRAIYFLSFKRIGWIQSRYHDQQYKSVHTSFSFTTSHSALLNPAHIQTLFLNTSQTWLFLAFFFISNTHASQYPALSSLRSRKFLHDSPSNPSFIFLYMYLTG